MNKKLRIVQAGLVVTACSLAFFSSMNMKANVTKADAKIYHVDFFNNYLREEFTLSSGFKGKGNNLLYLTVDVNENSKVSKPTDPTYKNHDFLGWFKDEEATEAWDFENDVVTKNTRLFASWEYSQEAEEVEPTYTPPSTVLDESAEHDYELYSVMSFVPTELHTVKVSTAALARLEKHKSDVLPLLSYKVKASKTLTATYTTTSLNNYITLTCGENVETIYVLDGSEDWEVENKDYEAKAVKYEGNILKEEENYHVMLAGSSSIEFWETSKEDMEPIVTYNHGIGGTTVEDWDECLNQRLVYPYRPKMVVYYVGINNVVNAGKTASQTIAALTKFFNDTHAALPDTKVQYILLNLVPGYPSKYNTIKAINEGVKTYQASHSEWLTLINPGDALLKENGEPNAAYFRMDGLHLTYYGYTIWGGIIRESIIQGLKDME